LNASPKEKKLCGPVEAKFYASAVAFDKISRASLIIMLIQG